MLRLHLLCNVQMLSKVMHLRAWANLGIRGLLCIFLLGLCILVPCVQQTNFEGAANIGLLASLVKVFSICSKGRREIGLFSRIQPAALLPCAHDKAGCLCWAPQGYLTPVKFEGLPHLRYALVCGEPHLLHRFLLLPALH